MKCNSKLSVVNMLQLQILYSCQFCLSAEAVLSASEMCVLWVASPPPLFLKFLADFYVEGAGSFFSFNKGQKWNEAEQARFKLGIQKDCLC